MLIHFEQFRKLFVVIDREKLIMSINFQPNFVQTITTLLIFVDISTNRNRGFYNTPVQDGGNICNITQVVKTSRMVINFGDRNFTVDFGIEKFYKMKMNLSVHSFLSLANVQHIFSTKLIYLLLEKNTNNFICKIFKSELKQ